MAKMLTSIAVENIRPKAHRIEVRDGGCRCLYLIVQPTGRKSWAVRYRRPDRKNVKLTLGSASEGGLTLAAARKAATDALHELEQGRDPTALKFEAAMAEKASVNRAPDTELSGLKQRVALEALTFLSNDVEPACYLYRHYHPSGDLLYVGISLEPLRRQDTHTKTARWRNMIYCIVIEPFATREDSHAAERLAIRTEFPKFNLAHNGHRHPIQELTRREREGMHRREAS